ncbi:MAG: DEAD/DEAH box helicase domain protein [Thermovirga lienii]|nr:MAG: DEAD/DEAH box helicase domain protein [Thermovirga lienii]
MINAKTQYFDVLREELRAAMKEKGFVAFTPVQEQVMAMDDHDRDMIVRSKTGSGKTLAFLLPLLNEGTWSNGTPKVLILSPTRELAQQTAKEARWVGRRLDLALAVLVGGMDMATQIRDLKCGASMVIGTPGRVLDHLRRGKLDLSGLETIVLDEGDQMLDMGFREELESIMDSAPQVERIWLFSATMPEEIKALARKYLKDPQILSVGEEGRHSDISHKVYRVPRDKRIEGLINTLLWENPSKALVFCRTKAETADIAARLSKEGFNTRCLHGDMSQRDRNLTLKLFREGLVNLLVATNVAARGLDIPYIEKVFQLGLPDDLETFTHRSGRTGRAGEKGENVVILNLKEAERFKVMLQRTKVKAEWLDVPDKSEILVMSRYRKQLDLMEEGHSPTEDFLEWAEELLKETDPTLLVAKLLMEVAKDTPCGYELRNELNTERNNLKKVRKGASFDGKSSNAHWNKSKATAKVVKIGLNPSVDWNVGKILGCLCNALGVRSSEVAGIKIRGQSVHVELSPLAIKNLRKRELDLARWGFSKINPVEDSHTAKAPKKRGSGRTVKSSRTGSKKKTF